MGARNLARIARLFPNAYWRRFDRRARALGLDRLCVILSYDCDTTEDAPAAKILHDRCRALGFKTSFAVPGEQLLENAPTYRAMAADGAVFLNHGFSNHLVKKADAYESVTMYNRMSRADIEMDIRRGHDTVREVTGQTPTGYRTPHFGIFQLPQQLHVIHEILTGMGYVFSSSTFPLYALTRGVVWKEGPLFEIAHAGAVRTPLTILDSYSYVPATGPRRSSDRYGHILMETVKGLLNANVAGVINLYADPAHVWDSPAYHQALDFMADQRVAVPSYEELLASVNIR